MIKLVEANDAAVGSSRLPVDAFSNTAATGKRSLSSGYSRARAPAHSAWRFSLTTANTTSMVSATFVHREPPTIASPTEDAREVLASLRGDLFLAAIKSDLLRLPHGDSAGCAAEAARRIADAIAPLVSRSEDLRYAAFDEGEGAIALVFHAHRTKRQVTVDVPSHARDLELITIDERMDRTARTVRLPDTKSLREAIEWLMSRA